MEKDDSLFLKHEKLLAEEGTLADALHAQRKEAKHAIISKESLTTHRAMGDLLIRRLREVEYELDAVERVIAQRFREGFDKIISASIKNG
jgi:hypothetical protein